jgi:hypothetical protein
MIAKVVPDVERLDHEQFAAESGRNNEIIGDQG